MLKRKQVLLNDWLSEWFNFSAKKYDLSYSELIRITLCLHIGERASKEFPHYEFNFSPQEMTTKFRKSSKTRQSKEELRKSLSRLYFETRKAIDFLMAQEKKAAVI